MSPTHFTSQAISLEVSEFAVSKNTTVKVIKVDALQYSDSIYDCSLGKFDSFHIVSPVLSRNIQVKCHYMILFNSVCKNNI